MGNLPFGGGQQSERIANTAYVILFYGLEWESWLRLALKEGPASHQLVGGVMAHQGEDA